MVTAVVAGSGVLCSGVLCFGCVGLFSRGDCLCGREFVCCCGFCVSVSCVFYGDCLCSVFVSPFAVVPVVIYSGGFGSRVC